MEWVIFFLILGCAVLLFPRLLRALKSSAKGGMGSVVMTLGMAFTVLLDPAKKTAIENLEKEKEAGNANKDVAGGSKD